METFSQYGFSHCDWFCRSFAIWDLCHLSNWLGIGAVSYTHLRLEKQLGGTYDLTANLENNVTIHGNDLASLKGADFIDQDYDLDKVAQNKVQYIRVTGEDGSQLTNEISLDQDGAYTVEYLTYKDAGYQARTVATQTVYVRGVTTCLLYTSISPIGLPKRFIPENYCRGIASGRKKN